MNIRRSIILSAAGVSVAGAAIAANVPFDRYEIILKRKPFGAVPVAPVAKSGSDVPVVPETDPENPPSGAFVETLRMCALTETAFGLRVGIIDIKSKPQVSYFLYEGETENGVELVEADYVGERALLKKDGEEYYLSMNSGAPPSVAPGAPKDATLMTKKSSVKRMSYAERLRRRREAEAARIAKLQEKPKISGEDLEQHLRQIQMDAIRKGIPALPIPLTKEMDDQLVAEGVLPPVE